MPKPQPVALPSLALTSLFLRQKAEPGQAEGVRRGESREAAGAGPGAQLGVVSACSHKHSALTTVQVDESGVILSPCRVQLPSADAAGRAGVCTAAVPVLCQGHGSPEGSVRGDQDGATAT